MKIKNLFLALTAIVVLNASCGKNDPPPAPATATTMTNVSYGTDANQKMDVYLPANRATATTKVIILVHGGAWIGGDKADIASFVDTLKRRVPDYAIININYRLAALPSTNVFPAQENDMKAAVDYVYSHKAEYLISDKFVLMGASAGGHLALLQAYKYTTPKIKAVVDYCGPTNMVAMYNDYAPSPINQAGIAALMSGTPATNASLYTSSSPLLLTSPSYCPTIIFQGTADAVVNATTQSIALQTKLTTSGVVNQYVSYPGLGHVDTWLPATFTDSFDKIGLFLAANVQ